MSEIIMFSLGMISMLVIGLLIVSVVVVYRLSAKVRIINSNLESVMVVNLPAIEQIISQNQDIVFQEFDSREREVEKLVTSRIDKLRADFDIKFNAVKNNNNN